MQDCADIANRPNVRRPTPPDRVKIVGLRRWAPDVPSSVDSATDSRGIGAESSVLGVRFSERCIDITDHFGVRVHRIRAHARIRPRRASRIAVGTRIRLSRQFAVAAFTTAERGDDRNYEEPFAHVLPQRQLKARHQRR